MVESRFCDSAPPWRHERLLLGTGITMHYVIASPDPTNVSDSNLAPSISSSANSAHSLRSATPQGAVLCVHGFPDTWYGFRHQIPAITQAGFHAIVPDQRGYGETDSPKRSEDYCMELLCADMASLLDLLNIQRVVLLGHDWGGALVWNFALKYPQRVHAVASVCTPFFPNNPDVNPWTKMQQNPGRFDYQVWFQTVEAQKELERNPKYSVSCALRGSSGNERKSFMEDADPELVAKAPTKKGGYIVGYPPPEKLKRSEILTEADLEYYSAQFTRSGYFGPLSWYRNVERNWQWMRSTAGRKVEHPSLIVTAGKDPVLTASMVASLKMHEWVPRLVHKHVENAGHWVLQEQPKLANEHIRGWLASLELQESSSKL